MAESVLKTSSGLSKKITLSDYSRSFGRTLAAQRASGALTRRRMLIWGRVKLAEAGRLLAVPVLSARQMAEEGMSPAARRRLLRLSQGAVRFLDAARTGSAWAAASAEKAVFSAAGMLRRLVMKRATQAAVMGAAAVFAMSTSFYGFGFEVILDGSPVGYVQSKADFEGVVADVEGRVSDILGHSYYMSPDVSYRYNLLQKDQLCDLGAMRENLFGQVSAVRELYVLTIDGNVAAAVDDEAAVRGMLDALLRKYTPEGGTASFVNDVSVEKRFVDTGKQVTLAQLREMLETPLRDTLSYTVREGDTFNEIARAHGMASDSLLELNPGYDTLDLSPGDELTIADPAPLISVESRVRVSYGETVSFETVYEDDAGLYKGQTKTVANGKNGEATITADILSLNGREIGRDIVSSATTLEPVTEVIRVGTATPPPKSPTGKYSRPYGGRLTSVFGWRTVFGRRDFHSGVDFAGPTGSAVKASDGGTVVQAGWSGGYGYCVKISHGNGVETLYGHNSKLLVTVGQKVAKGDVIAKVGSTGRTTGPHCHFEVRINGTPVNPFQYIK